MFYNQQDKIVQQLVGQLPATTDSVLQQLITHFVPESAEKISFYLSTADDLLRHPDDNPTIGLIICKDKNSVVAEYALRNINQPIGISEYKLTKSFPEKFKGSLPTIQEIEEELIK